MGFRCEYNKDIQLSLNREAWKLHLIAEIEDAMTWSSDKSKQTGAVIFDFITVETGIVPPIKDIEVVAVGCNTHTHGIDREIQDRPRKYHFIEHAERMAIYNAVKEGKCVNHLHMGVSWFPCVDCAKAIVMSGVKSLYYFHGPHSNTKKNFNFGESLQLLEAAGIHIEQL